jgi:hypothetical protein
VGGWLCNVGRRRSDRRGRLYRCARPRYHVGGRTWAIGSNHRGATLGGYDLVVDLARRLRTDRINAALADPCGVQLACEIEYRHLLRVWSTWRDRLAPLSVGRLFRPVERLV